MSYKKMSLIVLAVIAIVVGGLIYVRDHVLDQPHAAADITDLSANYQATDEIAAAKKQGKYVGICGQGPSDHANFALWLKEQGIDSLSLNPDTVVQTWLALAE